MDIKQQILKLQNIGRDVPWRISTMAILLLFLISNVATAQKTTDFGAILRLEDVAEINNNWSLAAKEDLRFNNDFSQFARSKFSLGFDYKLPRYGLKFGIGGEYIIKYTGKHIYRNRYRYFFNASYKYEYRNWEFGYRTRFLIMQNDEKTGYYNNALNYYWRNRLQVSYQRRYSRFKYSLSGELYSEINKDRQLQLNNLMFEGDVEYRLTRRQYLSVFIRDYRDIYIESDQIRTIYFGIGWKLKHF